MEREDIGSVHQYRRREMIGAIRRKPRPRASDPTASGPTNAAPHRAAQFRSALNDWRTLDEWPLALLFSGKSAPGGTGPDMAPDHFAALLRGLPIADLADNPDHRENDHLADERPVLFRGMQFLLRLRSVEQTQQRHHGANRLLLDHGCDERASLELSAGPHIIAARNSAPVMAAMLELATLLVAPVDAAIIAWGPADQIMPASYFVRTVTPFIHNGPWPIMALVQMHQNHAEQWQTIGLDWLFGQNITLDVPPGFDRLQALNRLLALAEDISENGPISEQGSIPGKVMGEYLAIALRPRSDGRRDVHARLSIKA